ncbi:hypothetical protein BDR04DRAFT_1111513 [Suillus decipiens]|nr:hypothetical protein BDR04DRAFT_1111513 [Suillus decipiens]
MHPSTASTTRPLSTILPAEYQGHTLLVSQADSYQKNLYKGSRLSSPVGSGASGEWTRWVPGPQPLEFEPTRPLMKHYI